MASEFCVLCGRTDVPLQDAVCAECFASRNDLITVVDQPTAVLCPTCGARQVGSHWERSGTSTLLAPEDLMPFLKPHPEVGIRRVTWEESGRNPLVRELRGIANVRFRGIEKTIAVEFTVHVEHRTCPECSRRAGHYYTSIIQLRGPEGRAVGAHRNDRERLHRLWDRELLQTPAEWRRSLSWEEVLPEGWDFYLTDTTTARALARWMKKRLGAKLTESPSLYGRKDGRDVYRVSFCLRVPRGPAPSRAGASGAGESTDEARTQVER
jgi:nonsense-mediated mRNA decay protein 3